MAIIKCKMCGGDLVLAEGQSVAECEYCGSRQTVPSGDNEKKLTLFGRANRLRAACEFDKAAGVYESIVADFPEEAEAYWGLVLCRYGIEYVDDPASGRKVPTCHRSSFESVMDDPDLEQALENADAVALRVYREEAKAIEEIRRGIIEVSGKEEAYDIFICYKETSETGDRTLDSVLAQDVYDALTEKGYRVFFSRITLEDKLGQEYEPYIFAALHSAKIMLAFGTEYEYFNAVWVKNEWSRYLKLMAADKTKHLIPCFKGIDAYDMPKEFAKLQAQDMGKIGAIQDLLRGIEKILPRKQPTVIPQTVVVGQNADKISVQLERGKMALEDGEWANATAFYEEVLNQDAKNAQAYLGKALADAKCASLKMYTTVRQGVANRAKAEKLSIPEDTSRINNAVKQFAVSGFLSEKELRSLYDFDLHYSSDLTSLKQIRKEEETHWKTHKQLSRAIQFGNTEVAAAQRTVLDALDLAVREAQANTEAARKAREQAYADHLDKADQKASALHAEAESRRETTYQGLIARYQCGESAEAYTELARLFRSLGAYQDAEAYAKQCDQCVHALQEKEKAVAEAAAAQAAKQAKKKKARNKTITILIVLLLIAAAAGAVVYSQYVVPEIIEPNRLFETAQTLYAEGKYESAVALLEENYFGARQEEALALTSDIRYEYANEQAEAGEYYKAISELERLEESGYSRAAERLLEVRYERAVAVMANGDMASAASYFEELGDYEDSASLAQVCTYEAALADLADADPEDAKERFLALGNYKDSADYAIYAEARILAEDDLFAAEELLLQLPAGFENSAEMLEAIDTYRHWKNKNYVCTSFSSTETNPHQYYQYAAVSITWTCGSTNPEGRIYAGVRFYNAQGVAYGLECPEDMTLFAGTSVSFIDGHVELVDGKPNWNASKSDKEDWFWKEITATTTQILLDDYDNYTDWMDEFVCDSYVFTVEEGPADTAS